MTINTYHWQDMNPSQQQRLFARAEADLSQILPDVEAIIAAVESQGDAALRRFTKEFDKVDLDGNLRVSAEQINAAGLNLDPGLKEAIQFSVDSVRRYHSLQKKDSMSIHEIRPGVFAGERVTPIPSVGLYVPHGRGSFPSVMYMLSTPAVMAGVPRIAVVTPPGKDGLVDQATLYTAELCGTREIYRVGGAHAVAALAVGTESIPRVDKILGPGSVYVAAAKRLLSHRVDVGMPAGPSESLILADATADPDTTALDLLIEAEHGRDSSAYLITPSADLAEKVKRALPGLIERLDAQRRDFVSTVLSGFGGIVIMPDMEEAIRFVNGYAPEHLQILCPEPFELLSQIQNAGEILLGRQTPFSLANYSVGSNNVLPTGGWAKSYSALTLRDFQKMSTVIYCTKTGFRTLKGPATVLAAYEGFSAHALALTEDRE